MTREPFSADKARHLASASAEKARQISEVAAAHAAGELAIKAEQRAARVRETADAKIIEFEGAISAAAEMAATSATMIYSERISVSRNSPEKVAEIEQFADDVSCLVVDELRERGFAVNASASEVRDYRDNADAQPEYFDTRFTASWKVLS